MKDSKRSNFREIGGQVNGYYRYLAGDRAEIMAHFQSREQIEKFTSRLRLRLEAEFDLAALKKSAQRTRARVVGLEVREEALPASATVQDQLDLMADVDLIAFASEPQTGDLTAARAEAADFANSREISKARLSFCDDESEQRPSAPLAKPAPKQPRRARSLSEIRTLGPIGLRGDGKASTNKKRRDTSA